MALFWHIVVVRIVLSVGYLPRHYLPRDWEHSQLALPKKFQLNVSNITYILCGIVIWITFGPKFHNESRLKQEPCDLEDQKNLHRKSRLDILKNVWKYRNWAMGRRYGCQFFQIFILKASNMAFVWICFNIEIETERSRSETSSETTILLCLSDILRWNFSSCARWPGLQSLGN